MVIGKMFFHSESDKIHNSLINVLTALGVVERSLDLKKGYINFTVVTVQPQEALDTFTAVEVDDDSFSA